MHFCKQFWFSCRALSHLALDLARGLASHALLFPRLFHSSLLSASFFFFSRRFDWQCAFIDILIAATLPSLLFDRIRIISKNYFIINIEKSRMYAISN